MILSSTSVTLRTQVTSRPPARSQRCRTSSTIALRRCPTCGAACTVGPQTYTPAAPSRRGSNGRTDRVAVSYRRRLTAPTLPGRAPPSYARLMSTLVLGREPVVEAWLAQRRALGQDARDEVWEGVYHVAPHEHGRNGAVAMELVVLLGPPAKRAGLRAGGSVNVGGPGDFRVPDLVWHRGSPDALYFATVAVAVEVLSPDDETFRKFAFYAAHGVEELWVVDPLERTARVWALADGALVEQDRAPLLDLTPAEVVAGIDWP